MNLGFSKILSYGYLNASFARTWLKALFVDSILRWLVSISFLINAALWAGSIFLARALGEGLAVLHYNVVFGIDLIGNASQMYIMPLLALVIVIGNTLLASYFLYRRERIAVIILISAALLCNLYALVALYFSYLANFS